MYSLKTAYMDASRLPRAVSQDDMRRLVARLYPALLQSDRYAGLDGIRRKTVSANKRILDPAVLSDLASPGPTCMPSHAAGRCCTNPPGRRYGAKPAKTGGARLANAGLQHRVPAAKAFASGHSLPTKHDPAAPVDRQHRHQDAG